LASKQQPRTGAPSRVTKAERKEQARRERIELQRKMARQRRNRLIAIVGMVVVGVAIVATLALTSNDGKTNTNEGGNRVLPGMMTGPAPWSANLATLPQRLARLNLPPFANPLALHNHAHLDLSINGSPVDVAASIGFDQAAQALASLHTHDTSGVVHMESSDPNGRFTLGEFFDVWGLKLTPSCIGGYCDNSTAKLRIFVDGKPFEGDPRSLELRDHEEIVIAYGTADQVPSPLPTFDWSKLVA
jgi:hypothetical protein